MLKYLAEFFGTMFFMFIILWTSNPLAIGVTLGVLIYLFGPISGGVFNPAAAIGLYLKKTLSLQDTILYSGLHIFAAAFAFYILRFIPKFKIQ